MTHSLPPTTPHSGGGDALAQARIAANCAPNGDLYLQVRACVGACVRACLFID